ncbi:thymidine phosphorylase, partial [Erwinia amylovora]|nr:thymidine phosphorylase [Erwinia amylovora]
RPPAVTLALRRALPLSGGLAKSGDDARMTLQAVLDNGAAAGVFARLVAAQNGPADFIERIDSYLPAPLLRKAVYASTSGTVSAMD